MHDEVLFHRLGEWIGRPQDHAVRPDIFGLSLPRDDAGAGIHLHAVRPRQQFIDELTIVGIDGLRRVDVPFASFDFRERFGVESGRRSIETAKHLKVVTEPIVGQVQERDLPGRSGSSRR